MTIIIERGILSSFIYRESLPPFSPLREREKERKTMPIERERRERER